ncbi:dihydropteroate synthase [Crateriforma conspicua]|uniref:Dihydropteroate synthase n=1 Tax=Crateriforma conspicua TaxID=2527996 RepID=A0A5C5YAA0_9PLAN|nr:dihydropteroate synthase [Crateriforma conspicua]TWT71245.1 Dihydropteroate synthase [Crateriforma conspicua]
MTSKDPATHWNLGRRVLDLTGGPRIMGILNVTPDSFSDGGQFNTINLAVAAAKRMRDEGANIIDIGGESTRPYADPVDADEERRRVLPVIERLAADLDIPISIDTQKAVVAREAVAAGADIINDVSGLQGDPDMLDVALRCDAGVCIMHMRGTPQTMQDDPTYDDVVAEIAEYLTERRQDTVAAGIDESRICLDPGIGFGKTHEHNLQLLKATDRFVALGSPVMIGHSRKGFIGKLIGDKQADRTAGTLGVSLAVAAAGAHVIRVHDVKNTRDALTLFEASGGLGSRKA